MINLIAPEKEFAPILIKGMQIDNDNFNMIAGPCCFADVTELRTVVHAIKDCGIKAFRAGAFKLRTSPYSFQGMGEAGLKHIYDVASETGLVSVSEIISSEDVGIMSETVDIIMVGPRNMFNYRLLRKLGETNKPIILKRGMSATITEWIQAAQYIAESGNTQIIMCERGIRTFENYTRNTLDISAVPAVKQLCNLPIIVDPSHAAGCRHLIKPLSLAAVAAGANGLLIEAHTQPTLAHCDKEQTIDLSTLKSIMRTTQAIRQLIKN